MENIQIFLDAAEAYGVPKTSLFQTVDLYEARNMSQVINTIMQLGTEVSALIIDTKISILLNPCIEQSIEQCIRCNILDGVNQE